MTHSNRAAKLLAVAAALPAFWVASAIAQTFPSKPIRLIHPFTAGSGSELTYRPVAEHFTQTLGQNVILEARPGGASMVATNFVRSQPPDGYTIYAVSNTATVRSVVPNPQVDLRKDFTHIAPSNIAPMIITVNPEQIKATTIKELLDEARARPGQINYASYGVGSGAHLFMEILSNEAKVKMEHVPYQGTAQAAADTVAGRTQVTGSILGTLRPHITQTGGSGRLRVLAVSTATRTPLLPEVPGMIEAGFGGIDFPLWGGYSGPAGIPRPIVDRLNRAVNESVRDPKIIESNTRVGVVGIGGTPEDLVRMIDREFNAYTKLLRETNIKVE